MLDEKYFLVYMLPLYSILLLFIFSSFECFFPCDYSESSSDNVVSKPGGSGAMVNSGSDCASSLNLSGTSAGSGSFAFSESEGSSCGTSSSAGSLFWSASATLLSLLAGLFRSRGEGDSVGGGEGGDAVLLCSSV